MKRILLAVALVALVGCESRRTDPLDEFASASCAAIQSWIDALEDESVRLSRAVTPLDDAADRVGFYREFTRAIDLRTWDTLRQLRRLAPSTGDARVAADAVVAAMERARGVTQELIDLAAAFPDGSDDPEPLVSRISSLFIRLEKAFVHPSETRDDLAERYQQFADAPACADYANPVS